MHLTPNDDHNKIFVNNVHPTDWVNPTPDERYNLVIVGGGSAGIASAEEAARYGARVALIERRLLGGDRLHVAGVPSKAIIKAARVCASVREAGEYGIITETDPKVDFSGVMKRMRGLRAGMSPADSAKRLKGLGIDVYIGSAKFTSKNSVEVEGATLEFSKALIATGGKPVVPNIPGLEEAGFLTNESIFSLEKMPNRLAIIGGGPVGCEMAQTFSRFGCEVSIVEVGTTLMPREDLDAVEIIELIMENEGVKVFTGARVETIESKDGSKTLRVTDIDGSTDVSVDEILVCVGRKPNLKDLQLDKVGVKYDEDKGIEVDTHLCTSNKRVYAAGDNCSNYKYTHAAEAMGRLVVENSLFSKRKSTDSLTIPWCTYTSPEIAHVGLYEDEAEKNGIKVRTFMQEFQNIDRSILDGRHDGFAKIHVREGTDEIVGATIVGDCAGDMISEVTLAIVSGIGLSTFADTIHPYPTQNEVLRKLGVDCQKKYMSKTHMAIKKRWLSWSR